MSELASVIPVCVMLICITSMQMGRWPWQKGQSEEGDENE